MKWRRCAPFLPHNSAVIGIYADLYATVAQLVEQLIRNQQVAGSNPASSSILSPLSKNSKGVCFKLLSVNEIWTRLRALREQSLFRRFRSLRIRPVAPKTRVGRYICPLGFFSLFAIRSKGMFELWRASGKPCQGPPWGGGMAVSGIEKYFKGCLFQATVRQRNMDEIARFARTISIPSLSLLTNPASSSKKPEWADTSVRSGFLVYLPVARKACSSFGAQAASPRQYAALIVALFNIMCPERAVCFLGSELARRASPRPTNSWRDSAP